MPPADGVTGAALSRNLPTGGMVAGVMPALVPAFDARAFRVERERALTDEWLPQCKGNASCRQGMTMLINQRVNGEVQAITAGNPDYKNKLAMTAFMDMTDKKFDPQFAAQIPKAAVVVMPPTPAIQVVPNATQLGAKPIKVVPGVGR